MCRAKPVDSLDYNSSSEDGRDEETDFEYGDLVSDSSGQMGMVVGLNLSVDLVLEDGSILRDIPSSELRRVKDFHLSDRVVFGSWCGIITGVVDDVTLEIEDGPVCIVPRASADHLRPLGINCEFFPYYPGQSVEATSDFMFQNRSGLTRLGTVQKVNVASVLIHWFSSASIIEDSDKNPNEEQTPETLKLLSFFTPTNWEVGYWCVPPTATKEKKTSALIFNIKRKVDVAWQDGSLEKGLNSTALVPVDSCPDHAFYAGQQVTAKVKDDSGEDQWLQGVVQSVNSNDETARVRWWMADEGAKSEVISVHKLDKDPDIDFRCGEVVFKLVPQDYDSDLSWVGIVTALRDDGYIEVAWADGTTSKVDPYHIRVADADERDDSDNV